MSCANLAWGANPTIKRLWFYAFTRCYVHRKISIVGTVSILQLKIPKCHPIMVPLYNEILITLCALLMARLLPSRQVRFVVFMRIFLSFLSPLMCLVAFYHTCLFARVNLSEFASWSEKFISIEWMFLWWIVRQQNWIKILIPWLLLAAKKGHRTCQDDKKEKLYYFML